MLIARHSINDHVVRTRAGKAPISGRDRSSVGDAYPYEIFELDRKGNFIDFKSTFRPFERRSHSDANKNDPKAASRCRLNTAYEVLGDEAKRQAFDRGEINSEGKPRFRGFEGFGAGAGRPGAGFGSDAEFETFSFGPEGFTRATRRGRGGSGAGFGSFEDILREAFSRGVSSPAPAVRRFKDEDAARAERDRRIQLFPSRRRRKAPHSDCGSVGRSVEVKFLRNASGPQDEAARPGYGWSGGAGECSDLGFNSATSHFHSQ